MAAIMPVVLTLAQVLPYLPSAVDALMTATTSVMKIVELARRDPAASEPENAAILDALDARIAATVTGVEASVAPRRQV